MMVILRWSMRATFPVFHKMSKIGPQGATKMALTFDDALNVELFAISNALMGELIMIAFRACLRSLMLRSIPP
jgi:hypothetical protein